MSSVFVSKQELTISENVVGDTLDNACPEIFARANKEEIALGAIGNLPFTQVFG